MCGPLTDIADHGFAFLLFLFPPLLLVFFLDFLHLPSLYHCLFILSAPVVGASAVSSCLSAKDYFSLREGDVVERVKPVSGC